MGDYHRWVLQKEMVLHQKKQWVLLKKCGIEMKTPKGNN